jgi:hypothetical protein
MSDRKGIIDALSAAVARSGTGLVVDALNRLADDADDALIAVVARLSARWAAENGAESLVLLTDEIVRLCDGATPESYAAIFASDPRSLDLLTTALQSADAERRRKASRFARQVGTLLGDAGRFALAVAVAAAQRAQDA